MPGSSATPGRSGARAHAPVRVAFRFRNGVSARDINLYEAQWLAYVLPYRRFAAALTGDHARLGVDVVRYSVIASDLHRLLVADLPAHCERFCTLSPPRLKPPTSLNNDERALFNELVSACSPNHFVKSDLPLVVSFVQSTLLVRRAAAGMVDDPNLIAIEKGGSGNSASFGAAERIDPKTLGRSVHQGPWPWEIKGA
jgi:hypothetical protein